MPSVTDLKEGTKTDWDSSKLTTIRIHNIISGMHECISRPNIDNRKTFLNLNECLYSEVKPKMSEKEIKESEGYRSAIFSLKNSFGDDIYMPTINGKQNIKYLMGWDNIWNVALEYQRFLMGSLENHGMLMKNAAKIEDSI